MSSFNLLSKNMQKKVWDMHWDNFTLIQDKTIPIIINTNKDVVVCSGTASGKTEAAFLPILSLIENSAKEKLKLIYISPLKALINNQFERIENLCNNLEITINAWHGDISQTRKNKFIKNSSGILQITPESIESLLINRTESVSEIFKEVDFIIVDEIHSFLNSARGVQLRSLLYRIENYNLRRPRIIGLSATVENFNFVKEWINFKDKDNVEIVEVKDSDKQLYYSLMHFDCDKSGKKPLELFEDMRNLTKKNKSIIFCNSRGEVEETTVLLNRLAEKEGLLESYYAHHSSIDKKEREYVEKSMAKAGVPKSVVATNSLELGIDIGTIEFVVQVDSTFTVSSLKQRLGRSGRKKDSNQLLQLYTTSKDSLLQSLAVMELLLEKWIEPAEGYPLPYDILFHQIISISNETNGLTLENLLNKIKDILIFNTLDNEKIRILIGHMLEKEYLELIKGSNECIVGIEGERILRSKDFYSVFMSPEEYIVQNGNKKIGQLDRNFQINIGDNIILAGKLWSIISIDTKRGKIYVEKASNAKPPKYSSGERKLNSKILEKMMDILCSKNEFSYINHNALALLNELRKPYEIFKVDPSERIIWRYKDEMCFETFTGTKIFRTLNWMLKSLKVNIQSYDSFGRIKISGVYPLDGILEEISSKKWSNELLFKETKDNEWFKSKYIEYLPEELQYDMHAANEIDIDGTLEYLKEYRFRIIDN
ncbi:DEAD/DEAH box helicase [Clostridium pasteurianum DSM 525 = ATCC 6013]|uniref:DEAD/DEAH box helicase n=1 Tax=Clostridium pasteurianum DSM 525 = ATCC 6013 TaxID=1262449 RepID=A0A0H3J5A6_CLOPA|nr:DEAD/DEAH box helicase [Clostridium pasteurianum]AJA49141.1 DEAD/DEAH box helicase [Clostridium pasteurianum DSM 525 = ATCC 6013]AJA53129.1 DEAD/DEAH box helicase [Clostridium pasteurianum DSM 525 = ATCC 6013]AOZ76328.1 DEAD/DEAH box helicase [Clostridium pasteurianum DSM 525 = ATCC 6013]AOZ80125.1 DEAD/DEAH box helicase [Clostridium pasteurianum]ELP59074.1 DEAD/DEAH box helicase [Clostridium pasteurianum DSM 525 = ATCC 6013]